MKRRHSKEAMAALTRDLSMLIDPPMPISSAASVPAAHIGHAPRQRQTHRGLHATATAGSGSLSATHPSVQYDTWTPATGNTAKQNKASKQTNTSPNAPHTQPAMDIYSADAPLTTTGITTSTIAATPPGCVPTNQHQPQSVPFCTQRRDTAWRTVAQSAWLDKSAIVALLLAHARAVKVHKRKAAHAATASPGKYRRRTRAAAAVTPMDATATAGAKDLHHGSDTGTCMGAGVAIGNEGEHDENTLTMLPTSVLPPHLPTSGSLFLVDKTICRHWRMDGHIYRSKNDRHENLKLDRVEILNVSYAHCVSVPGLHRRAYWLLEEPQFVLIHYLAPQVTTVLPAAEKGYSTCVDLVSGQHVRPHPRQVKAAATSPNDGILRAPANAPAVHSQIAASASAAAAAADVQPRRIAATAAVEGEHNGEDFLDENTLLYALLDQLSVQSSDRAAGNDIGNDVVHNSIMPQLTFSLADLGQCMLGSITKDVEAALGVQLASQDSSDVTERLLIHYVMRLHKVGVDNHLVSRPVLHAACALGFTNLADILMALGSKANSVEDVSLRTPLHLAALYGQCDTVSLLLAKGVNEDARDCDGKTALHLAQEGSVAVDQTRRRAVVAMLLCGADMATDDYAAGKAPAASNNNSGNAQVSSESHEATDDAIDFGGDSFTSSSSLFSGKVPHIGRLVRKKKRYRWTGSDAAMGGHGPYAAFSSSADAAAAAATDDTHMKLSDNGDNNPEHGGVVRSFASMTLGEIGIDSMVAVDNPNVTDDEFAAQVSRVQKHIRLWLYRRHLAARKLQAATRGMLARRSLRRLRDSTVVLQSLVRSRRVKHDYERLKQATITLQANFRSRHAKRHKANAGDTASGNTDEYGDKTETIDLPDQPTSLLSDESGEGGMHQEKRPSLLMEDESFRSLAQTETMGERDWYAGVSDSNTGLLGSLHHEVHSIAVDENDVETLRSGDDLLLHYLGNDGE